MCSSGCAIHFPLDWMISQKAASLHATRIGLCLGLLVLGMLAAARSFGQANVAIQVLLWSDLFSQTYNLYVTETLGNKTADGDGSDSAGINH